MKKLLMMAMGMIVIVVLAGCSAAGEEILTEQKAEFLDFKTAWNQADIRIVDPRVVTDVNGNKMLVANMINNTGFDLSEIVISYAVWDAQGDFCVIKSKRNPENTSEEFQVALKDLEIASGETWQADQGVFLSETVPEYTHVEVALVCCKMGDSIYDNPLYAQWKEFYLGQGLETWMKAFD